MVSSPQQYSREGGMTEIRARADTTDQLDILLVVLIALSGLACVMLFSLLTVNMALVWGGAATAVLALISSVILAARKHYKRRIHTDPSYGCCKRSGSRGSCESCFLRVLCIDLRAPATGAQGRRHRSALERYFLGYVDLSMLPQPASTEEVTRARKILFSLKARIRRRFREAIDLENRFQCGLLLKKDIQNLTIQSEKLETWLHNSYVPTDDEVKTMKDAISMISRNFDLIRSRFPTSQSVPYNVTEVTQLDSGVLLEAISRGSLSLSYENQTAQAENSRRCMSNRTSVISSTGGSEASPPPYQETDPYIYMSPGSASANTSLSAINTRMELVLLPEPGNNVMLRAPGQLPTRGLSGGVPLSRLPSCLGIDTTDPPPLGDEAPPSYEDATSTTV